MKENLTTVPSPLGSRPVPEALLLSLAHTHHSNPTGLSSVPRSLPPFLDQDLLEGKVGSDYSLCPQHTAKPESAPLLPHFLLPSPPQCSPANLACRQFLQHAKLVPTPGPLYWLLSLPSLPPHPLQTAHQGHLSAISPTGLIGPALFYFLFGTSYYPKIFLFI